MTNHDTPASPATPAAPDRPAGSRQRRAVAGAALVAAGVVLGAVVVGATNSSSASVTGPSAVIGSQQAAPQAGVPGAPQGETRVEGILTAVSGSSVTVQNASGTATYRLVAQTQVVRDGALARADALQVGDRVLAYVVPAAGPDGVLERLVAVPGSSGAGDGGSDPGAAGNTSTI